ncbi:MAG TPA: PTS fructose transporter subunit IIA [Gammaproteobacteria bacterium]|nr:PTS fructose transporter subunit IIA [Gammaproteobacteria bacterium]
MSVGLLILTHDSIGETLYNTAIDVIGSATLPTRVLVACMDCNTDEMLEQVRSTLQKLNDGEGVLILTDMYGATPSNIVSELLNPERVLVSGVNLPMLVRVMNYPGLKLNDLAEKAVSGGQDGILALTAGGTEK